MQKGFGFYSPHETTVLFQKATLVSIWIGLDLIVLFTVYGMAPSVVQRHLLLVTAAAVVLATGTVYSALFAWVTGSLFGRAETEGEAGGRLARVGILLKKRSWHLLAAGLVGAAIVLAIVMPAVSGILFSADAQAERGNPAVIKKCAEVAALEQSLFRSDERVALAQCMLQYDKNNTASRRD